MKHLFLPVLFWMLAFSQIFAQKTLPPGAQTQFEHWPRSVKKMMRSAGYDLENVYTSTGVTSRNAPLQLDSTKQFFAYDPTGKADSTPVVRTTYQYPQKGTEIETQSQFIDGAWKQLSRFTRTLDAQDRPKEILAEDYDEVTGAFVPASRLQLFLRGNSAEAIDSINAFVWDSVTTQWALAFQLKNTFGPQDRLLVSRTTIEVDGQMLIQADHYSYNANQDNHLIESFMELGSFAIPTGKQELMYADHRLIQVIHYVRDGSGNFAPTDRTTYFYNAAKLIELQNEYEWVPGVNDWKPVQNIRYQYDNMKRLVAQETTNTPAGEPESKHLVTFAYVEDEYVALETNYLWDAASGNYALDTRKYYYYAGKTSSVSPLPQAAQVLAFSPYPSTGEVRFQMNAETEVRVFDAAGQLVESRIVQPGETLNLTSLPNGLYQVSARNNEGLFIGKLVKQ